MGIVISIGGSSTGTCTGSSSLLEYKYGDDVSRFFSGGKFTEATVIMDGSSVADASYMFYGCKELSNLTLVRLSLNGDSVTTQMFHGCDNLNSVTLERCDETTVQRIATQIEIDGINAEVVSSRTSTIRCRGLLVGQSVGNKTHDTSSFKYAIGDDCSTLFSGSSFINATIRGIDTSSVVNMSHMFYGCSSLKRLDLSSFRTDKVMDMSSMFQGCNEMTELNLSRFSIHSSANTSSMFVGCDNLRYVNVRYCSEETIAILLSQLISDTDDWKEWKREGTYLIQPIYRITFDSNIGFGNNGGFDFDDFEEEETMPLQISAFGMRKTLRNESSDISMIEDSQVNQEDTQHDDDKETIAITVTVDPVVSNN